MSELLKCPNCQLKQSPKKALKENMPKNRPKSIEPHPCLLCRDAREMTSTRATAATAAATKSKFLLRRFPPVVCEIRPENIAKDFFDLFFDPYKTRGVDIGRKITSYKVAKATKVHPRIFEL